MKLELEKKNLVENLKNKGYIKSLGVKMVSRSMSRSVAVRRSRRGREMGKRGGKFGLWGFERFVIAMRSIQHVLG